MPLTVVLATDENEHRAGLESAMRSLGLCVRSVETGAEVLRALESVTPGLVLISTGVSDIHPLDVCRRIRRQSDVPLIVLARRSQKLDRVLALELGADDVVAEGCAAEELRERVKAAVRRGAGVTLESDDGDVLDFGHIIIDRSSRTLMTGSEIRTLTPMETELLWMLGLRAGEVVTSEELLESVWGYPDGIKTRTLDVHVGRLRRKLGEDGRNPRHIITVRSVGYRFEAAPGAEGEEVRRAA